MTKSSESLLWQVFPFRGSPQDGVSSTVAWAKIAILHFHGSGPERGFPAVFRSQVPTTDGAKI